MEVLVNQIYLFLWGRTKQVDTNLIESLNFKELERCKEIIGDYLHPVVFGSYSFKENEEFILNANKLLICISKKQERLQQDEG